MSILIPARNTPVEVKPEGDGPGPPRAGRSRPVETATRRRKRRTNAAVKIFRRLHMYFGLGLVPFVLLYGVTALLFNHPGWFSSSTAAPMEESPAPAILEGISADGLARQVASALSEAMEVPVEVVSDSTPDWRGTFIIDGRDDSGRTRYRVSPITLKSTMQVSASASPADARVFPERLETPVDDVADRLEEAFTEVGGHDSITTRAAPDIDFEVLHAGERWLLTYDLADGRVSERRADEPRAAFDLRRFLLRMHTAHGYSDESGTRSAWAVLVDVTAGLLVFWALSGIIMWWQMKPLRFGGSLALAGGLTLAGGLGYAMYLLMHF